MIVYSILWIMFSGICGFIANEKGRSVGGWMVTGFFLGIFALIAICAVPSLGKKTRIYTEIEDDPELRAWKDKMRRK